MNLFGSDFSLRHRLGLGRVLSASALALALIACGDGQGVGISPTSANTTTASASNTALTPRREMPALVNSATDPKLALVKSATLSAPDRVAPRVIELAALAQPKSDSLPAAGMGQPQQIGVRRDVAEAADATATASLLTWTQAGGRHRAAISVRSANAEGLRLGLRVTQLPLGTRLRVYAPGSDQALEISGAEVLRALQRNLDAGATGDAAYTYWLPSVSGAEAVLEVELAEGVDPATLKVALPRVSQLKVPPTGAALQKAIASPCTVDVMCTSGYETIRQAVAMMSFVDAGDSYACTGTLLNNALQDRTPYFLSANHCISTQASASTMETYWNYRTASCGGLQLESDFQSVGGGAQLLYASARTDTSFMRLNSAPPANAVFAGWNANTPAGIGASIFSIHHANTDPEKFSSGLVTGYDICDTATGLCPASTQSNGTFYIVNWSRGITQEGSSGGALFTSSNQQVIGQLLGGTSSCTNPGGWDVFGRLDLAYDAGGLAQWLSPTVTTPPKPVTPTALTPVYRFYNAVNGEHFYTDNSLERDNVIATLPVLQYEGPVFQVYAAQTATASPVYRFFNHNDGTHFYTISAAERDNVIATLPAFDYEGTAWYAQTAADGSGDTPLYRFFDTVYGTHFYTMSAAERDYVLASIPVLRYEGVAYYVWPLP